MSTTMSVNAPPRTPSTPVRAIPSTLLSRTAPAIPPASQLYGPLVKAVLRHRQYKIFLRSGFFSWFLVTAWRTWSGGDGELWLLPVRPSTLGYAIATFGVGALPIVVLHKSHLSATPTPSPSPSKTLGAAFQKRSTVHTLFTYLASSLSIAALHILITSAYDATADPHSRLSLFVKSRKHPYYLNGHLIYVVLSQAFVAFACFVRCILLDRFAVRWGPSLAAGRKKLESFSLARIVTVALTTLLYTLVTTLAYLVAFAFARSAVLPALYQLPLVPRLLKPFTAHFLRGQWTPLLLTRHWSLVRRAFYLALTTVGIWEFAESSFDAIAAEPVAVAGHTADPGLTLVSGITSADLYLKHFAYAELRDFASAESTEATTRRSALFGDQKHNPNMWSTLAREALLTLGRDYQLFLRRGQPALPPAALAPAPKTATPLPANTRAMPLLRTSVFKPPQSSPLRVALDTLASDGPLAAAVSETAEAGASHIPELFRSVMPATATSPAPASMNVARKAEENVENTKGRWREALKEHVPRLVAAAGGHAQAWWTRERVHRVAEASLPNRYVDALAVEVLCRLTCASLTEDAYGVVQRDIPRILEALLASLTALEEYQAELNAKYALPPPDVLGGLSAKAVAERETLAMEAARASEVCSVVTDAIKEGVVQIVRTFGEKLAAFKFPQRVARKLQGFVDYN
ncbi:nucleoporin protein Ndc1-Nup [Ganoderma leucocontextum]|nr:nucleoporin protein Ndc1-Nup [Ganoderma leucocontextum]